MYEYWICSNYDRDIFFKQCSALEKYIVALKKETDVEESVFGTLRQEYKLNDKTVTVICDDRLDDVHIESEIDLTQFFKK